MPLCVTDSLGPGDHQHTAGKPQPDFQSPVQSRIPGPSPPRPPGVNSWGEASEPSSFNPGNMFVAEMTTCVCCHRVAV